MITFKRVFAMPNAETFSVKPIGEFVRRYLNNSSVSVDPFARNKTWATFTNDLAPDTSAQYHMDAEDFCLQLRRDGVSADLGIFDPPYSPRQISEVYKRVGREVGMAGTQNGALYRRVRDALDAVIAPGGVVLSFGWNSAGMGITRGYEIEEILLVAHGGGHNDTICVAERKSGAVAEEAGVSVPPFPPDPPPSAEHRRSATTDIQVNRRRDGHS